MLDAACVFLSGVAVPPVPVRCLDLVLMVRK